MQYVVQAGDTLYTIAQKFGTTVEAIAQANNITNINVVYVGQVLTIPADAVTPVPPIQPPIIPIGLCPELRVGSRGTSVSRLQNLLLAQGLSPGPIDGIYGAKTEAAVRFFQAQKGLAITGVVDVNTWNALGVDCGVTPIIPPQEYFCPRLKLNSSGAAVRFLQRLLQQAGYYKGTIDGKYDARTRRAVRNFQRDKGLNVTGRMDIETWEAMGVKCIDEPKPPIDAPIDTKLGKGLRHILYTNKKVYNRGEKVKISLIKTNVTDDEVNLRYRTNQIKEITITMGGSEVWDLAKNKSFGKYTRLITIFPGGTQLSEEIWDQENNSGSQVRSGVYTITVENIATNVKLSTQIRIR